MSKNTARNVIICFVVLISSVTLFNDLRVGCDLISSGMVSISMLVYLIMFSGVAFIYFLICLIAEKSMLLVDNLTEFFNKKVEIKIKIKGGKND